VFNNNLSKEKIENGDVAVYIVTHGPECRCIPDYCLPIEVGAESRNNFHYELRDNSNDDNISKKNKLYGEMTGLYWIWKNADHQYTGLYHYRRILNLKHKSIIRYLKKYDFILPRKITIDRKIEEHYKICHVKNDWEIMMNALKEIYPEYYATSQKIFQQNSLYCYNIFITKKEELDKYCSWLFPLLGRIENRLDLRQRDAYQSRAIGFICERLLNLYVMHNNFKIKEVKSLLFGDIA
jgi:hypothetical protein